MKERELTPEEILNSKIYINQGGITFPGPKSLLGGFFDQMHDLGASEVKIATAGTTANQNNDSTRDINIAYARVKVQANFKMSGLEGHKLSYGMLYALDIQNPVIKAYVGINCDACTNLSITNAEYIYEKKILGDYSSVGEFVNRFLSKEKEIVGEYLNFHSRINQHFMDEWQVNHCLGFLLNNSCRKDYYISINSVTAAAKMVTDPKSVYYCDPHTSSNQLGRIYNACTQTITNSSDILYSPEKSLKMTQLFNEYLNDLQRGIESEDISER